MPNYSKAPRGLFVQVGLGRVFTANAISPSESSRQLLTRDAFRAGQNLPGKELRYLRTVIVTAVVSPELWFRARVNKFTPPLPLTYRHWTGVSLYT